MRDKYTLTHTTEILPLHACCRSLRVRARAAKGAHILPVDLTLQEHRPPQPQELGQHQCRHHHPLAWCHKLQQRQVGGQPMVQWPGKQSSPLEGQRIDRARDSAKQHMNRQCTQPNTSYSCSYANLTSQLLLD